MLLARDLKPGDKVRYTKGYGTVYTVKKSGLVSVVIEPDENPGVTLNATPYFLERVE